MDMTLEKRIKWRPVNLHLLLNYQHPYVKSFFIALLLTLVFPNALVLTAAKILHLDRPFINVDYFFAFFLFIAGKRFFGTTLLVLVFFVDIICLITNVLPFIRFQDLFIFAKNIPLAPFLYKVVIEIGLLSFIFSVFIFIKSSNIDSIYRKYISTIGLVIFNIVMTGYAIEANFFGDKHRSYHSMIVNIQAYYFASSQSIRLYNYKSDGFLESFSLSGDPFVKGKVSNGASKIWFDRINKKQPLPEKMLLVVNESWGVPLNAKINEDILSNLSNTNNQKIKDIQLGEISSPNITVGGEYRELCHLYLKHFNLKDVTTGFDGCLPNKLKKEGYLTASFHGASEIMYDRKYWYPRVGFDRSTFFESKQWPSRCYSFPGACDVNMKNEVAEFFNNNHKEFGYWMTLNTHSIYDPRDLHIKLFDCKKYGLSTESESCRNLMLQAQFFYDLKVLINKPSMKGVEVIVVGDHAPVIIDQNGKDSMWKADHVSWVKFRID